MTGDRHGAAGSGEYRNGSGWGKRRGVRSGAASTHDTRPVTTRHRVATSCAASVPPTPSTKPSPPWDRGRPARACTQQDADHQNADKTAALPGAVSQRYAQSTHVGHVLEATLRAIDARRHVLRGNAAGFRHTPSPPRCNAARFRRTSITSSVQRSARLAHVCHLLGATSRSFGARPHDLVQRSARLAHCHTTSVQRRKPLTHAS